MSGNLSEIRKNNMFIIHPLYVNVTPFIKESFARYKHLFYKDKAEPKLEFKFLNDEVTLSRNMKTIIRFNPKVIKFFVTLLDTKELQETFLLLLLFHECSHSIIDREEYEYNIKYECRVNAYARMMLGSNTSYNANSITKAIDTRLKYLLKDNTDYYVIRTILSFPVVVPEYYLDGGPIIG